MDTSQTYFDTVEETGGSANASVITHTHSVSGTAALNGGHQHKFSYSTWTRATGSNTIRNVYGSSTSGESVVSVDSAGAHTHSVSGTAAAPSGAVAGTGKNLQPYVTVYYWKRTA